MEHNFGNIRRLHDTHDKLRREKDFSKILIYSNLMTQLRCIKKSD